MMRRTGGLVGNIGLSLSIATQGAGTSPVLSSSRVREIYCQVQACDTPGVKNNVTSSEMGTCGPFKVTSILRCGVDTKQIKSEIGGFLEAIKKEKDDGSPAMSPEQIRDTVEKLEKQEIVTLEQLKKLNEEQIRACTIPVGRAAIIDAELQRVFFPSLRPPRSPEEFVTRVVAAIREIRSRKLSNSELRNQMNEKLSEKTLTLPLDPRGGACDTFVRDFLDPFLSHHVPHAVEPGGEGGGGVPISVNYGAPGSGKTTLLFMLMKRFVDHFGADAVPLFITFNGGMSQGFDEGTDPEQRVYFRILGAMTRSSATGMQGDVDNLRQIGKALGFANFSPWTFLRDDTLLEIAAEIYGPTAKICVFGDEFRKVAPSGVPLTRVSDPAVNAMRAVSNLSQHSAWVARCKGQGKSPIIFGCVSALTCLDPVNGLSEGSQRPCTPIPLPPAVLEEVDEESWWLKGAKKGRKKGKGWKGKGSHFRATDEARTLRRMVLWSKQYNMSAFKDEVALHKKEAPTETGAVAYFKNRLTLAEHNAVKIASAGISDFLDVCTEADKIGTVDQLPLLITNLFWPRPFVTDRLRGIGAFAKEMKPSIRADTSRLGAIFRDHELKQDTTYIHPLMLKPLLEWKDPETGKEPSDGLPRELLKELCDNICAIPKHPETNRAVAGLGKAYEDLILRAFLLRIALCPDDDVQLDQLLLGKKVSGGPDILRTKVKAGLKLQLLNHFKGSSGKFSFPRSYNKDTKEEEGCSPMPPVDSPDVHYVLAEDFHAFCTVNDSLIQIPIVSGSLVINIGIQNKEYKDGSFLDALRRQRLQQLQWKQKGDAKGRVAEYLSKATFVNVVVTPNKPEQDDDSPCRDFYFVPESGSSKEANPSDRGCVRGYEILVTHDDIRSWSPTVAYSGCDARVLNMKD